MTTMFRSASIHRRVPRLVSRLCLPLLALQLAACADVAPADFLAVDDAGVDVASIEQEINGPASYTNCGTPRERVFREGLRRARIGLRSRAFRDCVQQVTTGVAMVDGTVDDGVNPAGSFGPVVSAPGAKVPTVTSIQQIADTWKRIEVTCDPADANMAYSGVQDASRETFSFANGSIVQADDVDPDLADMAATYFHEIMHDYGFGHDAIGPIEGCLISTLRASAAGCARYEASACPNGMYLRAGTTGGRYATRCECVTDTHAREARHGVVPATGAPAVLLANDISLAFASAKNGSVAALTWSASPSSMWHEARPPRALRWPDLPDGTRVSAIVRGTRVELFASDNQGRIQTMTWDEPTQTWTGPTVISAPEFAYPGGPVTAIARNGKVHVLAIGSNWGIKELTFDTAWRTREVTGPNVAMYTSDLTIVARGPDHLDLFFPGTDGSVLSTWWHEGVNRGSWHPLYSVMPAGTVAPNAHVSAIARDARSLDVFAVDTRGVLQNATWVDGGSWGTVRPMTVPNTAVSGGPIASISRRPNRMDVFAITASGAVTWVGWDLSAPRAFTLPVAVIPSGVASDANLAVTSSHDEHMEIFAFDRGLSSDLAVPTIQRVFHDERTQWRAAATFPAVRAPANVSASPSFNGVTMSWLDDEGSALRYQILGRQPDSGSWIVLDTVYASDIVPQNSHATRSYTVTGLAELTAYSFKVCTANGSSVRCSAGVNFSTTLRPRPRTCPIPGQEPCGPRGKCIRVDLCENLP